jgi:acyl-coenzyme A thioesterase PaaI-like protein
MAAFTKESMHAFLRKNLPAGDDFGEQVEEVLADSVRLSLALRPEHMSHDLPEGSGQRVVSGPLMMGLADTAMYAAVHAAYGPEVFATIITLNITFLKLPATNRLCVEARILRKTKKLCFLEATLSSAWGEAPSGHVTATYSAMPTKT